MTPGEPIVLLSAVLYMALGVIAVLQMRRCHMRAEPIALLIMSIHGLIFFVSMIVDFQDGALENPQFWNMWSSTLRFHSIMTVVSIEFFRLLRLRRGTGGCQ